MVPKKKITVFFRNDDVFELDSALIAVTETLLKKSIPISHQIIPAKLTQECADWLLEIKEKFPDLIELGQHGFMHMNHNPDSIVTGKKYEFGDSRTYKEQLADISKGRKIMQKFLGSDSTRIFSPPYYNCNPDTVRAVQKQGFEVISADINTHIAPDILGRLSQVPTSIDLVNWGRAYRNKPETRVMEEFRTEGEFSDCIGLCIHHRTFNTAHKILKLERILDRIKKMKGVVFSGILSSATRNRGNIR